MMNAGSISKSLILSLSIHPKTHSQGTLVGLVDYPDDDEDEDEDEDDSDSKEESPPLSKKSKLG